MKIKFNLHYNMSQWQFHVSALLCAIGIFIILYTDLLFMIGIPFIIAGIIWQWIRIDKHNENSINKF